MTATRATATGSLVLKAAFPPQGGRCRSCHRPLPQATSAPSMLPEQVSPCNAAVRLLHDRGLEIPSQDLWSCYAHSFLQGLRRTGTCSHCVHPTLDTLLAVPVQGVRWGPWGQTLWGKQANLRSLRAGVGENAVCLPITRRHGWKST